MNGRGKIIIRVLGILWAAYSILDLLLRSGRNWMDLYQICFGYVITNLLCYLDVERLDIHIWFLDSTLINLDKPCYWSDFNIKNPVGRRVVRVFLSRIVLEDACQRFQFPFCSSRSRAPTLISISALPFLFTHSQSLLLHEK